MDSQLTPVESMLVNVPLCNTPLGRAAVFGSLGAGVAYFVRPSMSFKADGTPKEWILLAPSDPEATLLPWWAYIVTPAVLFGVFV